MKNFLSLIVCGVLLLGSTPMVHGYNMSEVRTGVMEIISVPANLQELDRCRSVDAYFYYHESVNTSTLSINQICTSQFGDQKRSIHLDRVNVSYWIDGVWK